MRKVRDIALGMALGLLIFEGALRVLGWDYHSLPLVPNAKLHHAHPTDYHFRYFQPGDAKSHDIYYDADGIRRPRADGRRRIARECMAFMGDSMVEANQVRYEDSFVGLLDSVSSEVELLNFGVSGYSPYLYRLQWDEQVRRFSPTRVFLMVSHTDVWEDRLYESIHRGAAPSLPMVALPGLAGGWFNRPLRNFYIGRFLRNLYVQIMEIRVSKDAPRDGKGHLSRSTIRYLDDLVARLERSRTELIVMMTPSKAHTLSSDAPRPLSDSGIELRRWAHLHGLRYVDLETPLRRSTQLGRSAFFELDLHLNEEGHRVVADAILKAVPDAFGRGA